MGTLDAPRGQARESWDAIGAALQRSAVALEAIAAMAMGIPSPPEDPAAAAAELAGTARHLSDASRVLAGDPELPMAGG